MMYYNNDLTGAALIFFNLCCPKCELTGAYNIQSNSELVSLLEKNCDFRML